ncbi:hypothetical protein A1O1_06893 [Capronia coronata CBS 617.96]|uniref:Clr5 domain-containing protein n=1 Tax=Capronia coronata CBS 617.96 TaxID=1182541 RepID=W9YLY3_9EURO|nr:uncharacterized protein A1O1_06893 [Capronia coronata CBS 617.96]EXJ83274.1 hypothetical protein A1O1_06893 [Capronia coronata CBS 617.96]
MRAAARLLADHLEKQHEGSQRGSMRSSGRPVSFLIRGEEISHAEFLRYFRRKKINDPVKWVKENTTEDSGSDEDIKLLGAVTPESASAGNAVHDVHDIVDLDQAEVETNPGRGQPVQEAADVVDETQWDAFQEAPSTSTLTPILFRPQAFQALEHSNYSMATYITSYTSSPRSLTHVEPAVHAYTVHAVFASKMADGMALLVRLPRQTSKTMSQSSSEQCKENNDQLQAQTAAQAFDNFQHAFELVRTILSNDHPMSLALMLSTVCELVSHANMRTSNSHEADQQPGNLFWTMTAQLLQYTRDMASLVLGSGHALTTFFALLAQQSSFLSQSLHLSHSSNNGNGNGRLQSEMQSNLTNLIVTALRVATVQYISTTPSSGGANQDWKTMYLRERFCDSLYHSGSPFAPERVQQRRLLLDDQERFYGLSARNVLYTLTNVADDALVDGDIEAAIGHFQEVLSRAETLTDYGRAKTRFAALEGLGKCYMARAEAEAEAEADNQSDMVDDEWVMDFPIEDEDLLAPRSMIQGPAQDPVNPTSGPGLDAQSQPNTDFGWQGETEVRFRASNDMEAELALDLGLGLGFDSQVPNPSQTGWELELGVEQDLQHSGSGAPTKEQHGEDYVAQGFNFVDGFPVEEATTNVHDNDNAFETCQTLYNNDNDIGIVTAAQQETAPHPVSAPVDISKPGLEACCVCTCTCACHSLSHPIPGNTHLRSHSHPQPHSQPRPEPAEPMNSQWSGESSSSNAGTGAVTPSTSASASASRSSSSSKSSSNGPYRHPHQQQQQHYQYQNQNPHNSQGLDTAQATQQQQHLSNLVLQDRDPNQNQNQNQNQDEGSYYRLPFRQSQVHRNLDSEKQQQQQKQQQKQHLLLLQQQQQKQQERKTRQEQPLRQALTHLSAAEAEARIWFDATSRRTARVRVKIEEIRDILGETPVENLR